VTTANAEAPRCETIELVLHDATLLERVVGLIARLGCTYASVRADRAADGVRVAIRLDGDAAAVRRLRGHYARLLDDDKEMSR